ncbi:MAG: dienelactone hydrolase family protein [Sneathiellaceae bacterium]
MAKPPLFAVLAALFLLPALGQPSAAAGFQQSQATDSAGRPLDLAIWYPSAAPPQAVQVGPFALEVARDGGVAGSGLPLIVLSHGAGGSSLNAFDTATALADAGFVVVAPLHAGDNYRDQSDTFTQANFLNRPGQVSRTIDHMLTAWQQHGAIDPSRIGILGHSAGGTTALLLAGGRADWRRVAAFCTDHPQDWGCANARAQQSVQGTAAPAAAPVIAGADPRLKAVVLAAPALSVAFAPDGLAAVTVPVQLWVAAADRIVGDAAAIRRMLPGDVDMRRVPDAGHFAFLAPCSDALARIAPPLCTDAPGFDRRAFLAGFQQTVIAFFRKHLGPAG